MDLAFQKEHIDTFVIVSGDSDFSPLVSKLKENGKHVIGLGMKDSTSDLLRRQLRRVHLLRGPRARPQQRPLPVDRRTCPRRRRRASPSWSTPCLALRRENKEVLCASMVKDTMKRKKPSFNETYYGYRTFTHLLEDAQRKSIVTLRRDQKLGQLHHRRPGRRVERAGGLRSPDRRLGRRPLDHGSAGLVLAGRNRDRDRDPGPRPLRPPRARARTARAQARAGVEAVAAAAPRPLPRAPCRAPAKSRTPTTCTRATRRATTTRPTSTSPCPRHARPRDARDSPLARGPVRGASGRRSPSSAGCGATRRRSPSSRAGRAQRAGRVRTSQSSSPGTLSVVRLPPCSSAMRRTTPRPRPDVAAGGFGRRRAHEANAELHLARRGGGADLQRAPGGRAADVLHHGAQGQPHQRLVAPDRFRPRGELHRCPLGRDLGQELVEVDRVLLDLALAEGEERPAGLQGGG